MGLQPRGGHAAARRMPADGPDEAVVRAILAGRPELFESLIRRHQRPLVNFLFRMIGDSELALDMAQEVFTKAFLALDRYNPSWRFTTWLYRIASNAAIDHLRRHRPPLLSLDRPSAGGDGPPMEIPSPGASPAEELEFKETARRLGAAIDGLPPAYRQLILLRHAQQMRYDEIAAITGLPLGTVKNRIFRARELLRERLEEHLPALRGGIMARRAGRPAGDSGGVEWIASARRDAARRGGPGARI